MEDRIKPEYIQVVLLIPFNPYKRYVLLDEVLKQTGFIGAKLIRVICCVFTWMAG